MRPTAVISGEIAYLAKPVRRWELRDAVLKALGQSGAGEPARPGGNASTVQKRADHPLRILLADYNPVNQQVARRLLPRRGHSIAVAGNGREALDALEGDHFDLILMDLQMPVMGGFEATAAIREKEKATGEHVPVIALTVHAMKGDEDICLQSGMDGYVSKPIQPLRLFQAIEDIASACGLTPYAGSPKDA